MLRRGIGGKMTGDVADVRLHRPRPTCFVAMPFGSKAPPNRREPTIDFDTIWAVIERAVAAAGLEPVRADVEPGGGFIHRSMYERLMVAEYVIADLTFANANVTYEVGLRHGTSNRPTILIGASDHLGELPFDFRPLRVLPYDLGRDGRLSAEHGAALVERLGDRLRDVAANPRRVDNPIMQITSWSGGRLEHDKTDVFLERMEYADELGAQVEAALRRRDADGAIAELGRIERDLLDGSEVVAQLHSTLLSIYLGYRKHGGWQQMVDMFDRLPAELRATAVAQEQLALALNRLAEATSAAATARRESGDREAAAQKAADAEHLRRRAIDAADLPEELVTAETWGIRGRIYKGWFEAETEAGNELRAAAALHRAIEAYEAGVRADLRDYYPGINAVTLRLRRSGPGDAAALDQLVPVVRMAADVAPAARSVDERYWQTATKMELASAAGDFVRAREHLVDLLGCDVDPWMHETTAANLRIHAAAFADDADASAAVRELIAELAPDRGGH